jgi:hypothetical protein
VEIAKHRSNTPQSSDSYDAEIDTERGYEIGAHAALNAHCQR